MISAAAATNSTAPTGTRLWLSFVQMRHPGTARSRENANVMRDRARDAGHAAEQLADGRDEDDRLRPALAHRAREDRGREAERLVDRRGVRRGERDREQHDPADHGRV